MKYLPFEDFEIQTTLTSDEVYYRLCASVDTERKWLIFTNKPFWGEVDRRDFRIWRATWWNHNIGPVISGKIWPGTSGCCIVIRMRMPWFGFLFWLFWLGAVLYMYFGGIAYLIIQKFQTGIWQIESPLFLLPGIVIFALGYLIFMRPFKSGVRYIRDYLLWLSQTGEGNIIYRDEFLGFTEPQIIRSLFLLMLIISLGWIVFSFLR